MALVRIKLIFQFKNLIILAQAAIWRFSHISLRNFPEGDHFTVKFR